LEILKSAESAGANRIIRPNELATDKSSSESVALHALKTQNIEVGCLLLIQPTSPFVDTSAIKEAYKILKFNRASVHSIFSCVEGNFFLWEEKNNPGSVSKHDFNQTTSIQRLFIPSI
jgi:N-acylneuraminate cytidylyltransferase